MKSKVERGEGWVRSPVRPVGFPASRNRPGWTLAKRLSEARMLVISQQQRKLQI